MPLIDLGHGPPVVLIPGVQGRWEWMRPAVKALARRCRVITFSYGDEPTARVDAPAACFDDYVEQVALAMDSAGLAHAVICGVSYGGLVASAFAARHPERVSGLIFVSALPPSWRIHERAAFYLRAPRLLAPLFCLGSLRLYREIAAAVPGLAAGLAAALRHGWLAATHPFDARRMARRARWVAGIDWSGLDRVRVPVLLVTGEPALERVVPPAVTLDYRRVWPHARHETLPRTGHLGLITRPEAFADIVVPFVTEAARAGRQDEDARRQVG